MKITKFDTQADVSVKCEMGTIPIEGTYESIGYFKVSGEYKFGSAGSDDADHIYATMAYAQARYHHRHWLIDLTELHYEWGDEFDRIWDMGQLDHIDKCATVVGPMCWEAISTLANPKAAPRDCLEDEDTFDSLEDAYAHLLSHMKT